MESVGFRTFVLKDQNLSASATLNCWSKISSREAECKDGKFKVESDQQLPFYFEL